MPWSLAYTSPRRRRRIKHLWPSGDIYWRPVPWLFPLPYFDLTEARHKTISLNSSHHPQTKQAAPAIITSSTRTSAFQATRLSYTVFILYHTISCFVKVYSVFRQKKRHPFDWMPLAVALKKRTPFVGYFGLVRKVLSRDKQTLSLPPHLNND